VDPVEVGLVGAGPWAERVHAPMLAAGPETRLTGVWARRPEAAQALAARHGVAAADSFEALLEGCEAVAFAVPPDVQATLATRAARAGRHLLLEKPLALTLDAARRLADAADTAGVITQLVLSYRFRADAEAFLDAASRFETFGARAAFLTGGSLTGPYATPWRREHGALLDLGPHVIDLLEAAMGPIADLSARGDPRRWTSLTCVHEGGAVSTAALSGVLGLPGRVWRIALDGPAGTLTYDPGATGGDDAWPKVRAAFAEGVRSGRAPLFGVHRGVWIHEMIRQAMESIAHANR